MAPDEYEQLMFELASAKGALSKMRDMIVEMAAKQAAQRMFLIGLAAHAGQKMDTADVIVRGLEEATRDARRSFRNYDGRVGQLIVDELARMSEELRGRL